MKCAFLSKQTFVQFEDDLAVDFPRDSRSSARGLLPERQSEGNEIWGERTEEGRKGNRTRGCKNALELHKFHFALKWPRPTRVAQCLIMGKPRQI